MQIDFVDVNLNLPPSVRAICHSFLPSIRSVEWIATKFKLDQDVMLGLYAVIHGATDKHMKGLEALTLEVMARMRIDENYLS